MTKNTAFPSALDGGCNGILKREQAGRGSDSPNHISKYKEIGNLKTAQDKTMFQINRMIYT